MMIRLFFRSFRFLNLEMDSSDEEYLPDPNRPRKRKRPPDQGEASGSGQGRRCDGNQQSGLNLHDDFIKGKCSFLPMCVTVMGF